MQTAQCFLTCLLFFNAEPNSVFNAFFHFFIFRFLKSKHVSSQSARLQTSENFQIRKTYRHCCVLGAESPTPTPPTPTPPTHIHTPHTHTQMCIHISAKDVDFPSLLPPSLHFLSQPAGGAVTAWQLKRCQAVLDGGCFLLCTLTFYGLADVLAQAEDRRCSSIRWVLVLRDQLESISARGCQYLHS